MIDVLLRQRKRFVKKDNNDTKKVEQKEKVRIMRQKPLFKKVKRNGSESGKGKRNLKHNELRIAREVSHSYSKTKGGNEKNEIDRASKPEQPQKREEEVKKTTRKKKMEDGGKSTRVRPSKELTMKSNREDDVEKTEDVRKEENCSTSTTGNKQVESEMKTKEQKTSKSRTILPSVEDDNRSGCRTALNLECMILSIQRIEQQLSDDFSALEKENTELLRMNLQLQGGYVACNDGSEKDLPLEKEDVQAVAVTDANQFFTEFSDFEKSIRVKMNFLTKFKQFREQCNQVEANIHQIYSDPTRRKAAAATATATSIVPEHAPVNTRIHVPNIDMSTEKLQISTDNNQKENGGQQTPEPVPDGEEERKKERNIQGKKNSFNSKAMKWWLGGDNSSEKKLQQTTKQETPSNKISSPSKLRRFKFKKSTNKRPNKNKNKSVDHVNVQNDQESTARPLYCNPAKGDFDYLFLSDDSYSSVVDDFSDDEDCSGFTASKNPIVQIPL